MLVPKSFSKPEVQVSNRKYYVISIETDNGIFRLSTCYMRLGNSLLAFLHISKASIGLPIYVYRIGPCCAQG